MTRSGQALCVGAIGVLGGCSAPALPAGYYEAEALEREGRLAEAQRKYAETARSCRKKPPECAVTAFRSAQMLERLKRPLEAEKEYLRVASGVGRGLRVGARSLYRVGLLRERRGEIRGAEVVWWRVIDHYPEALAADNALRRIIRLYRRRKALVRLVTLLRERFQRLRLQDIADNLLFESARILEKDLGRLGEAAALYLKLPRIYRTSSLRDDAWWAAAGIRRRQKRYREAIRIYQYILATREDALGGASYHSEWLDNSQFEIGRIYLLDLRQPRRAIRAFRQLVTGFATSVLRDDAQFWIVIAEVERGREARARRAFSRLKERFPRSRFLREAKALSGWYVLRRAARTGKTSEACQRWRALRQSQTRSWLVRHGPRPRPWPRCGRPES